ncbi:MAG: AzlD domain-containing protein [Lachnospiraceae bacterium]
MNNFWLYLLIMFGVTYAIRVLPFIAFRKKIKNRFFRSFLMYVPYTVLGAMTFPAVFYATGSLVTSMAGVAIALVLAYRGKSLFEVAIFASLMAFVVSMVVSV